MFYERCDSGEVKYSKPNIWQRHNFPGVAPKYRGVNLWYIYLYYCKQPHGFIKGVTQYLLMLTYFIKNYYDGLSVKGQIKSLLFSLNKTISPDHPRGRVNKTLFFPTMWKSK